MKRVYLMYLGNCMELPEGASLIGRSLLCRMRFNDSSVSRKHLLLRYENDQVTAEDLGSRNGSRVNDLPLTSAMTLHDGDELAIGNKKLKIVIVEDERSSDTPTRPEFEAIPMPRIAPPPAPEEVLQASQQCPRCRKPVDADGDRCEHCGASWADFHTRAVTQEVRRPPGALAVRERRRHMRHKVDTPVLYTSENLTIESVAVNLSRSGMFMHTEILDQVGTPCTITLMTDGAPAVSLSGRVSRTVEKQGRGSLGLGIEFTDLSSAARRWLDDTLARVASK